jgi:hypothetical protein
VVISSNPRILPLIPVVVVPLMVNDGVVVPYTPELTPYSNQTVVSAPLALALPFRIAERNVTLAAIPVDTAGAVA